jgi:hypothetical protein
MNHVRPLSSITSGEDRQRRIAHPENPWPLDPAKGPRCAE